MKIRKADKEIINKKIKEKLNRLLHIQMFELQQMLI